VVDIHRGFIVSFGEAITASTEADPCGMTNKRTGNGKNSKTTAKP
jgi:hypothetical protein